MKDGLFNEKIVTLVKDTYVELLRRERLVFTRNEKKRLLQDVLREIFDDILASI
jgi:hypothetical protein